MSYTTPPPNDPYGQSAVPTPGGPGGPPPGKGFFGALFDFSFEYFVTPMIVKGFYLLSMAVLGTVWLILLVTSFANSSSVAQLAVLVLGPVAILLYLCLIRMTLEFYLAVTRMSQDIHHRPL